MVEATGARSFEAGADAARHRAGQVGEALDQLYPRLVAEAERSSVSPGTEWMLDNHFVVRRALRRVRSGLVRSFERRLPSIEGGPEAGLRRIEVAAFGLLRGSEGLLDRAALVRFARELETGGGASGGRASLAELWALPLLLRLGLLEQLIRDGPALLEPALDTTRDHRVANCVRSLLLIEKTDWSRFVEEVSEVHEILGHDPTGHYRSMDFTTRDRYRRAVETLARRCGRSESEVARQAIERARRADPEALAAHVGFQLVDPTGAAGLCRELGACGGLRRLLRADPRRRRALLYIGSIWLVALAHLLVLGYGLTRLGVGPGLLACVCILAIVPAWTIGVSLIDWLVSVSVSPTPLAKLDFSAGVPPRCRTLVVVPGMLTHPGDADVLAARLEGHYLSTRDPNIELALATDFGDADAARLPEDEALLTHARARIAELNRRYGEGGEGPFHLFHRQRVWSEAQERWMGWERKRGKLEELNRLLCGETDTSYVVHEGGELLELRYVITLDADTILPLGVGRRLIETLAHPLNVARFDATGERVISGYTVLQPRTEIAPEARPTRFARAFAGDGAFDIYSRAVSNVYQDLFGEGSFVGKGIYDLAAFRATVEGRLPTDRILSHDLLEGLLGRAGLVTDVIVYEDYPSSYVAYARRLHRWIRGDWQVLAWLWPRVPTRAGRARNRLGAVSRWKIADNLRRSLLAPSLVGFAVVSWATLAGHAWLWTVLTLAIMATPTLAELGGGVLQIRPGAVRPAVSGVVSATAPALTRWFMRLSFSLHEAANSLDAISRALIRTTITRRRQLEWTPAAIAGRDASEPRTIWRALGPSVFVAALLGLGLGLVDLRALLAAAPLLLAWLLAPPLAIWSAQPAPRRRASKKVHLSPGSPELHRLARQTWGYFEHVIGPEDHWLPPDHFQEHPKGELAHRSSPTNIAMALLATVAAYDFGYIDLLELVVRLRNTVENLGEMPRHHGHVLNWCDTTTLAPLEPRYVSTVDSGNLAAALLVLEQTCRELAMGARPLERRIYGLRDGLDVLAHTLEKWGAGAEQARALVEGMRECVDCPDGARAWPRILGTLDDRVFRALDAALLELFEAEEGRRDPSAFEQLRTWTAHLRSEVTSVRSELGVQLPWLMLLDEVPGREPEELSATLERVRAELALVPTLGLARGCYQRALEAVEEAQALAPPSPWSVWLDELADGLHASLDHEAQLRVRLGELAERCVEFVAAMDFGFLYDENRELFYIGYNLSAERYDPHHYDLLASEARVASLIGIAKGEVSSRHWAKLGRPLGRFGGTRALLSWSGTMFEYLMPTLFFDEGEDTLLDASAHAVVRAQIEYGRRRGVPWGISESGYARLDSQRNYQYRAFGVPGTGFRRELERELVIAPYASLLALCYEPDGVVANLEKIEAAGGFGPLGLYEALDYTSERVPLGSAHAVVRSYMSHHQGMILLAVHSFCCGRTMVERAHRHPMLAAVDLLLHERPPGRVPIERPQPASEGPPVRARPSPVESWPVASEGEVEAHLISNGRYGLVLTAGGAGHSFWKGLALTRPCEDSTLEDRGLSIGVRDQQSGEQWSFLARAEDASESREVAFSAQGARVMIHERGLVAELSVNVAHEIDAELRVLQLSDRSGRARRLQISAFAELVLGDPEVHARHPAFAKLFVDSQICVEPPMIVCRRRIRSPGEPQLWLGCALVSDSVEWDGVETDRGAYLGRGGSVAQPWGRLREMPRRDTPLQATLDTCVAVGGQVQLHPWGSCECAVVMFVAPNRSALIERGRELLSMAVIRRLALDAERLAGERAIAKGQGTSELRRYQRLFSAVVFPRGGLRAPAAVRAANLLGQPGLWRHGISGDWPVLVVRVSTVGVSTIAELLRAQARWQRRGFPVDLVLIEERASGYGGDVRQRLAQVFEREGARLGAPDGGVFMIHGAGLDGAERELLLASASLVLDADLDELDAILDRPAVAPLPTFEPQGQPLEPTPELHRPEDLLLDNGLGGFTPDGRAYLIHLEPGSHTPAPWINVIANPQFGCVVSERGAGYSWSQNAGLNRITPWSNDPLLDLPGESLYLRDELDGALWSPTPGPAPAPAAYQIRHGAGWTSFTHHSHGLRQRVEIFVAPEEPVKVVQVELENLWQRGRRLTLSYCVEWLLGAQLAADTRLLSVDFDPEDEVALARNAWNPSFADRWAFAAASRKLHGMSSSRIEFFGRRGSRRRPAALRHIGLSGESTADADPCAALQVHLDLGPGERTRVHFLLGQAEGREAAIELATRLRDEAVIDALRLEVDRRWDELLGAVEVHGPEPWFDLLVNRWLLYQCVSSRLWARTGLYQSSGAFGFRDQLQDVLALLHAAPELARAHLVDAARRQYEAGDVQHWWHPPTGQGLRSRCSDDLVWLPFAVAHYVEATGDLAVLREATPYLDSPPLGEGELERYEGEPRWSGCGTLYEHCMAALARAGARGVHDLPLIGSCDWNDGFSRVGTAGRGESVWLGWFLVATCDAFAAVSDALGRDEDAASLRARAEALVPALEAAWDGAWYRRAYDDEGEVIGGAGAQACEIDSIAQSWAVISGRADPERGRQAMASVWERLVVEEAELVRLFAPAFDSETPRLGYIEAYPPGVRENGGQYTHAAIWVGWALAELGEAERAHAVLRMILPSAHSRDPDQARRYRVEPYVIVADIYAEAPHVGRGGWTWYTGAAGWAYRLAVEEILGVRRVEGRITLDPALPPSWPGCRLILRERGTEHHVELRRSEEGSLSVLVNGVERAVPFTLPAPGPAPGDDERRTAPARAPTRDEGGTAWPAARRRGGS